MILLGAVGGVLGQDFAVRGSLRPPESSPARILPSEVVFVLKKEPGPKKRARTAHGQRPKKRTNKKFFFLHPWRINEMELVFSKMKEIKAK